MENKICPSCGKGRLIYDPEWEKYIRNACSKVDIETRVVRYFEKCKMSVTFVTNSPLDYKENIVKEVCYYYTSPEDYEILKKAKTYREIFEEVTGMPDAVYYCEVEELCEDGNEEAIKRYKNDESETWRRIKKKIVFERVKTLPEGWVIFGNSDKFSIDRRLYLTEI